MFYIAQLCRRSTMGFNMISSSILLICFTKSSTCVMFVCTLRNMSGRLYCSGSSLNSTMPSFWLMLAKISPDLICKKASCSMHHFYAIEPCSPYSRCSAPLRRHWTAAHGWPRRSARASGRFSSGVVYYVYTRMSQPAERDRVKAADSLATSCSDSPAWQVPCCYHA